MRDIERVLRENQALLGAIVEQQNAGQILSAAKLLERLQENLAYVSAIAEAGSRTQAPLTNGANGGTR